MFKLFARWQHTKRVLSNENFFSDTRNTQLIFMRTLGTLCHFSLTNTSICLKMHAEWICTIVWILQGVHTQVIIRTPGDSGVIQNKPAVLNWTYAATSPNSPTITWYNLGVDAASSTQVLLYLGGSGSYVYGPGYDANKVEHINSGSGSAVLRISNFQPADLAVYRVQVIQGVSNDSIVNITHLVDEAAFNATIEGIRIQTNCGKTLEPGENQILTVECKKFTPIVPGWIYPCSVRYEQNLEPVEKACGNTFNIVPERSDTIQFTVDLMLSAADVKPIIFSATYADINPEYDSLPYEVVPPCLEGVLTIVLCIIVSVVDGASHPLQNLWLILVLAGILPVVIMMAVTLGVATQNFQDTDDWDVILAVNLAFGLICVAVLVIVGGVTHKRTTGCRTDHTEKTKSSRNVARSADSTVTASKIEAKTDDTRGENDRKEPPHNIGHNHLQPNTGVPVQQESTPRRLPPLQGAPTVGNNKVRPDHSALKL